MRQFLVQFIDVLIPLCVGLICLVFPQWLTKKDLKEEENEGLAKRFRIGGWLLLAAALLIFIAQYGSRGH